MKIDKRKKSYKRVYKNNKLYAKILRNLIYFLIGTLYLLKKLIIELIRNTVRFIIGLLYIIYSLFKSINTFNIYLFNKLNNNVKMAFIYALIALNVINLINAKNVSAITPEENEKEIQFIINVEDNTPEEVIEYVETVNNKKDSVCDNEIACKIYEKAMDNNMTHEQAILLISISKHETGNWTSSAFKNKNNFGGICNSNGIKIYDSFDDGLDAFVNLLKNRYFNRGLNTIEEIGNVYCPIGASNDPNGVNQYWIPNVTKYYNEYINK